MAGKALVKDITFKKIMFKLHYFLIRSTLTKITHLLPFNAYIFIKF